MGCTVLNDASRVPRHITIRRRSKTRSTSHPTNEFRNKHARYFIVEHGSKKLAVGVEVRNTLPIIEREELGIKQEICEHLDITPLFAVRWLKPYIELVRKKGGFSWVFKTRIYSPGFERLTRTIYKG